MKITKCPIGIFLLTFLIGYVAVLPIKKVDSGLDKPFEPVKFSEGVIKSESFPQDKQKVELETIEEIDAWTDEENLPDVENYSFKMRLLETGKGFHGGEVKAESGEVWLGLFKEKDGYYLRPARLKIRLVYDDIMDYEIKNARTGKDVIVEGKNDPLYLLKNTGKIQKGKITTLFQGLNWADVIKDEESEIPPEDMMTTLKKGFFKTFELHGKKTTLKVIEAKNNESEKVLGLIIESEGVRQILHTVKYDENFNVGHLYWVGDLDKDGKLDFYFDLFEHYNVMNRVFYLSSSAEKGKLIKKVAYFWTSGC